MLRLLNHRGARPCVLAGSLRRSLSLSTDPPTNARPLLHVALVGRPNTGKSTLYNRLTGTKMAIVSAVPGTTRDRREGYGYLAGLPLKVVDTGGLDDRGEVSKHIQYQVARAVQEADIVLLMLDSKTGVTALDRHFALWLRKTAGEAAQAAASVRKGKADAAAANAEFASGWGLPQVISDHNLLHGRGVQHEKRVLVIANKAEGVHRSDSIMDTTSDALRLGFGEAVPLSAAHGDGMAELATLLMQEASSRGCLEEEEEGGRGVSRARISKQHRLNDTNANTTSSLSAEAGAATGASKPVHSSLSSHAHLAHNAMPAEERLIQLAIMGRPNVGKSTILNAIVGDDRSITGPMAGLTRDSVHVEWEFNDRRFRLVDTAGLTRTRPVKALLDVQTENRRVARQEAHGLAATGHSSGVMGTEEGPPTKVPVRLPGISALNPEADPSQFSYQVSELALLSALNALRFAQVVCLVIESSQQRFSQIDLQIAQMCLREGRGLVILANKRDLLGAGTGSFEDQVKEHCDQYLPEFGDIPVIATSGLKGQGLRRGLEEVVRTHDAWSRRVDTWILNRWLKDMLVSANPARVAGKEVKLKYVTQTSSRPPEFLLFANVEELPGFFERFLRKRLQEAFDLKGVPVRFVVRKTAGTEIRKELLKNNPKSRRGTGMGEGRGVGPRRDINLGVKRHVQGDARDQRRRRDTRNKGALRKGRKGGPQAYKV